MARLADVADGKSGDACSFYNPSLHMTNEQRCAQTIGLRGKAGAVRASIGTARFSSYNGWTLAKSTIGGQAAMWVLDHGHFRFPYGYRLV